MKNKKWILPGLITLMVAAGFLVIGFSSHASAKKIKENSTCCQQQKMKNCSGKMNDIAAPGVVVPENLSRQFLSIMALGH
jgi:hypothetical protein